MNEIQKQIMHDLQIELVKWQKEVILSGQKILIILEGRDAAGKDGTIKRLVEHLSPRETRVVALNKPTEREESEWYFQRYAERLPSGGEIVIFNRSWYNRAGVEKVMGFCSKAQYQSFFEDVELFEKMLVNSGIIILKYYLDISEKEQEKRLLDRKNNPLKQWKISPIDQQAQKMWKGYSQARNEMLLKTNFKTSPWYIVNAENKEAMRMAIISHVLSKVSYRNKNKKMERFFSPIVWPASHKDMINRLYK